MKDTCRSDEIMADNERTLKKLANAIRLEKGKFSLKLVRCNYTELRKSILEKLHQDHSFVFEELSLTPKATNLINEIPIFLENKDPNLSALMVLALEQVEKLDQLFANFNKLRTQFQNSFKFSLVLWVTDEVLAKVSQNAPDFRSGGGIMSFRWTTEELVHFLHGAADELFHLVLQNGAGGFLPYTTNIATLADYRRRYQEIESAWQELQARNIDLEDRLKASYLLAQAGSYYVNSLKHQPFKEQIELIQEARQKYQESLEICQHIDEKTGEGTLFYCLSLCERRLAELERSKQKDHWSAEEASLVKASEVFKELGKWEIEAKLRNKRGEVLQHLEQWEQLNQLAEASIDQDRFLNNRLLLAEDYGFLAKVALERAKDAKQLSEKREYAQQAEQQAEQALDILRELPQQQRWHTACYLLLLAQAKKELEQLKLSIKHLKEALKNIEDARNKTEAHDRYEPELHIEILDELQETYYQNKNYLEAFEKKQERLSLEGQHGLKVFIGASSLQPQVSLTEGEEIWDYAIESSGRRKDVEALIERLSPPNSKKLTIIHGPSGVGKTSMIEAGLVPKLRQTCFSSFRVVPVSLRLSKTENWIEQIGQELKRELDKINIHCNVDSFVDYTVIIEQLKKQQQLATVLIFDQFEDFFFICKPTERQELFRFLIQCFEITNVWAVLSLREDYIYYLLEIEKTLQNQANKEIETDYQDFLSYKNRYPLKNFEKSEAILLITKLSENSQIQLDPELVNEFVDDLAKLTEEVRPIELQIVGAQLQEMGIETRDQYLDLAKNDSAQTSSNDIAKASSKEFLIQQYLKTVVKACGEENEEVANLVLILLTDESDKRPLKTLNNFKEAILNDDSNKKLKLVLEIFVKSGMVVLSKEATEERYQLVHDYLAILIRHQLKSNNEFKNLEDKLKKVSEEVAKERTKAAEERARANEAEQKVKLVGDLQQAQERIRRITKVGGVLSLAVGILTSALVYFFSDRAIQIGDLDTQSSQIMKSHISGTDTLEQSLHKAWQGGRKFQEILKFEKMLNTLKGETFNDFQDYPIHTPVLALQQLSDSMELQTSFTYNTSLIDTTLFKGKLISLDLKGKISEHDLSTQDSSTQERIVVDNVFKDLNDKGNNNSRLSTISPDSRKLALVLPHRKDPNKERMVIWDIQDKTIEHEIENIKEASILSFSHDSRWLAIVTSNEIFLYDAQLKNYRKLPVEQNQTPRVISVSFSPSHNQKLALGFSDAIIKLVNLKNNFQTTEVKLPSSFSQLAVENIRFNQEGDLLAIGLQGGILILHYIGKNDTRICPAQGVIKKMDFLFDDIIAVGLNNGNLKLISSTCSTLYQIKAHQQEVEGVQFDFEKTLLVTYSKTEVRRWDLSKLDEHFEQYQYNPLNESSLAPDGKLLATGSARGIQLWNLDNLHKDRLGRGNNLSSKQKFIDESQTQSPVFSISFNRFFRTFGDPPKTYN